MSAVRCITRALVSFFLLTSTPAPVEFYLYLPLSRKKISKVRGQRYDIKGCGRGESRGQGHFTLPSASPFLLPCLLALSLMLWVSLGRFVLNSCEFVIKKNLKKHSTIFLLPWDSLQLSDLPLAVESLYDFSVAWKIDQIFTSTDGLCSGFL